MRMRYDLNNSWIIGVLNAIISVIAIGVIFAFAMLVYLVDLLWGDGPSNKQV